MSMRRVVHLGEDELLRLFEAQRQPSADGCREYKAVAPHYVVGRTRRRVGVWRVEKLPTMGMWEHNRIIPPAKRSLRLATSAPSSADGLYNDLSTAEACAEFYREHNEPSTETDET